MSNSKLATVTILSPNHSGKRTHAIDTITVHCMAGNLSVESCGYMFAQRSREASSNYGIGSDGRIALYVDEANRSWCTSSRANDQRAVTIEVANTAQGEPWPISDAAYKSLVNLLTDICQRNGIKKLLWKADKSLIGQVDKQNMTAHRWFAAKSCPGNMLYAKMGQIAAEVNARLDGTPAPAEPEKPAASSTAPKMAPAEKRDTSLSGAYKVTASNGLNMRYGPGTSYAIIQTIKKGTVVRNYGYYSARNGVKWLYVQVGKAVGFVHSGYLAKI